VRFEFTKFNETGHGVMSPEDKIDQLNSHIMIEMGKCRNLDFFSDVVFHLDEGKMLRVNSLVLQARSEYFRSMFDPRY
jgi:hypothetical protein